MKTVVIIIMLNAGERPDWGAIRDAYEQARPAVERAASPDPFPPLPRARISDSDWDAMNRRQKDEWLMKHGSGSLEHLTTPHRLTPDDYPIIPAGD